MQCKLLRIVSLYHYTMSRKEEANMDFYTHSRKHWWFLWNLLHSFLKIYLQQNYLNVLHLTLIMSVHCALWNFTFL